MRLFIKNLFLFILPFAVFLAFPFAVLMVSGELYPLSAIEKLSAGTQTVLVGQAYSNYGQEIKRDEVNAREPRVITLGNSHVGEFRSMFFREPKIFYNTSGAAGALSDYAHFVEQIKGNPPEIIIANMEPNIFNPENAKNNAVKRPDPYTVRSRIYDPFFESLFRNGGWWKVYADYFSGKFALYDALNSRSGSVLAIGLRARTDRAGFTNDGSDYYGDVIHNQANQSRILPAIDELASNISANTRFNQYGSEISGDAINELRTFLALSKEKGIFVVGFSPPIAHKIYMALKQKDGTTYAFKNLAPTLAGIYREYGFDFYDFSDISSFGSSDSEMVEVQHGGEKMYLRIFIRMAEGSAPLGALVDLPYLKEKLADAGNAYYVFGIDGY